jgi:hypothetical protein
MVLVTACSDKTIAKPLPDLEIPEEKINTIIQLVDAPELANSHVNSTCKCNTLFEEYLKRCFEGKTFPWSKI